MPTKPSVQPRRNSIRRASVVRKPSPKTRAASRPKAAARRKASPRHKAAPFRRTPTSPSPEVRSAPKLAKQDAQAQLDKRHEIILANLKEDVLCHYRIGRAWADVVDLELVEQSGSAKSPREYLKAELKTVPKASLMRYSRVARVFKEEIADEYGMAKLELLLTLDHLSPFDPLPANPGSLELPSLDPKAKPKKFATATEADLTNCIRAIKSVHALLPIAANADDAKLFSKKQGALNTLLGDHSTAMLKAHTIHGEEFVDIVQIPLARLQEALQALARA